MASIFDPLSIATLVLIVAGMAAALVWARRSERQDRARRHGRYHGRMHFLRSLMHAWHGPRRLTDQRSDAEKLR